MPLHLAPASKSDIPQLVNLYFTTFKSPLVLRVKPDVPPVREWFRKNLESDMEKAYTRVYKVVESEEEGAAAADEGEIIAFAKWNAPFVEEVGKGKDEEGLETEGKWPADGDVALFKEIVEKVTEKKRILMENKSFWCKLSALHAHNSAHLNIKSSSRSRCACHTTAAPTQRRGVDADD